MTVHSHHPPPDLVALLRLGEALSIPPEDNLLSLIERGWPIHDLAVGFSDVMGTAGCDALIRTMAFFWSSDTWSKGQWHGFMDPSVDCPLWVLRYVMWHFPELRAGAATAAATMGVHPWSVEPSFRSRLHLLQGGTDGLHPSLMEKLVSSFPEHLRLVDLAVDQRFHLEYLPKALQAINLQVRNNASLRHLDWPITANHLQVTDCPNLRTIGPSVQAFYARFARLPALEKGPRLLRSQGEVRFEWCEGLKELWLEGEVDQLTISSCHHLRRLTGPVQIRRLAIHDCPALRHPYLYCAPKEVIIQESPLFNPNDSPLVLGPQSISRNAVAPAAPWPLMGRNRAWECP